LSTLVRETDALCARILGALNMLYVLVATGRASIDQRHTSRELFFNVKA